MWAIRRSIRDWHRELLSDGVKLGEFFLPQRGEHRIPIDGMAVDDATRHIHSLLWLTVPTIPQGAERLEPHICILVL